MKEKISLKDWAVLAVGMLLVAVAVYYVMIPSELVMGSLSGLVLVLANFIPLSISALTLILNVALLVLGFLFIGREFGGKTVIASLLLPLYIRIFETVTPNVPVPTSNSLVNVLCFVLLLSLGQTMLFNINASSGGLDIVGKLLNKYLHIELGKAMILSGFAVAASSILVYDRETLIVSLVGMYLGGVVLDYFIDGSHMRKKICILSPRYEEIQRFIVQDLHRGATLYQATGAWNNEAKVELVTILQTNEYAKLLEFVHRTDPSAFVTVSTVGQVIGYWREPDRKHLSRNQ